MNTETTSGTAESSGNPTQTTSEDTGSATSSSTESGAQPPADYVPALVAVGYGGLRVVSRDNGLTWGDQVFTSRDGNDDLELLRTVSYGNGLWIAAGTKIVTSPDAVNWTEQGLVNATSKLSMCYNIVEGLAFADGYFYATCWNNSSGMVFRSANGKDWTQVSTVGQGAQHYFVSYHDGLFVIIGDENTSYSSPDATGWEVMAGLNQATYCEGEYKSARDCHDAQWIEGAYYKAEWGGFILRSTDGGQFKQVYADDSGNNVYQSRAIAPGYAAP